MGIFGKKKADAPADAPVESLAAPVDNEKSLPLSTAHSNLSSEKSTDGGIAPTDQHESTTADETNTAGGIVGQPGHGVPGQEGDAEKTATATAEENAEGVDDAEVDYPKSMQLFLISMSLCLSIFCLALDNTIISTAIPRITDEFKALNDVGWYASAYLLTTCAFQLLFGKLYTYFSLKWIYLSCLFIFEVGSAVCGSAPNSTALIIGRAVAGLGCAGLFSGALLIVANTVPLHKRPTYTA